MIWCNVSGCEGTESSSYACSSCCLNRCYVLQGIAKAINAANLDDIVRYLTGPALCLCYMYVLTIVLVHFV